MRGPGRRGGRGLDGGSVVRPTRWSPRRGRSRRPAANAAEPGDVAPGKGLEGRGCGPGPGTNFPCGLERVPRTLRVCVFSSVKRWLALDNVRGPSVMLEFDESSRVRRRHVGLREGGGSRRCRDSGPADSARLSPCTAALLRSPHAGAAPTDPSTVATAGWGLRLRTSPGSASREAAPGRVPRAPANVCRWAARRLLREGALARPLTEPAWRRTRRPLRGARHAESHYGNTTPD